MANRNHILAKEDDNNIVTPGIPIATAKGQDEQDKDEEIAVCPKCGKTYIGCPALSRMDSTTEICPECGIRESLDALEFNKAKQDEAIAEIRKVTKVI